MSDQFFFGRTQNAEQTPFDNTSNGFLANQSQAAIEEVKNLALAVAPIYYSVTGTSNLTTTSSTFSVLTGMTLTPSVAGDYLVVWSAQFDTGNASGNGEAAIFVAGTQQTALTHQSQLDVNVLLGVLGVSGSTEGASNIVGKVTLNGSQAVDVRFRSIDGNTITVSRRSLTLVRIIDAATLGSVAISGIQHAPTHLPSGSDPLATGTAFSTGTQNTSGSANSYSLSDHIHNTVVANQHISANSSINTTSNAAVVVTGMTLTVAVAGTYLILANLVWLAAGNNTTTVGIYNSGVLIANTAGSFVRNANNPMTYAGMTVQSLAAGDVVTLRWNTSGGQQITANLRSLTIVRLG